MNMVETTLIGFRVTTKYCFYNRTNKNVQDDEHVILNIDYWGIQKYVQAKKNRYET